MTQRDDTTKANEDAKDQFDGKQPSGNKRPQDGKDVTEVNEAADAQFNADETTEPLGNRVGGLRGSSD